jgi:predicted nucleic acid-binding protein
MILVADTSPLRYLVQTGYEFLLPRLFTKVWIPGTVTAELRHARTPAVVRQWAEQLPSWVEVRQVRALLIRSHLYRRSVGAPSPNTVHLRPVGQTIGLRRLPARAKVGRPQKTMV